MTTPMTNQMKDVPEEIYQKFWNLLRACTKITSTRGYKKINEAIFDLNAPPDQAGQAVTHLFERAVEECVALYGTPIKFNEKQGSGFVEVKQ